MKIGENDDSQPSMSPLLEIQSASITKPVPNRPNSFERLPQIRSPCDNKTPIKFWKKIQKKSHYKPKRTSIAS